MCLLDKVYTEVAMCAFYYDCIYIHQENRTMFDRSERNLVSTLDEMRSLWQEFVRRKAADTVVSNTNCMGLPHVCMHNVTTVFICAEETYGMTAFMLLSVCW